MRSIQKGLPLEMIAANSRTSSEMIRRFYGSHVKSVLYMGSHFVDKEKSIRDERYSMVNALAKEIGFEFDAYEDLRLGLGVPDGSRDLVVEKSILLEAGFDELNGVDWHKGCYIGQELTARTKYRGLIKRRLVPVAIDGPAPTPGTVVTADGRDVGEMRSSNGGRGLALLRTDAVVEKKRLMAGDAVIVPTKPAWMHFDAGEPEE